MKRIYQGNYYDTDAQGNEFPCAFRMEVEEDVQLNFHGTVWEEKFHQISGKLLTVKGFIDKDHISFVKLYPCYYGADDAGNELVDPSKPGHEVLYDGYWNDQEGKWMGEWKIESDTLLFQFDELLAEIFLGRFEMRMVEETRI